MNKLFGHLKTVLHHKRLVFFYSIKAGIPLRGLFHDLSKFSPTEFINGVKYYTNGCHSPTVEERLNKGYSAAWLHHKGKNKHHFEYWTELNWRGNMFKAYEMPVKYVKEMFCDRLAATKTYLKDKYTDFAPLEYYLARDEQRLLHEKTASILGNALIVLAENGEKAAFDYLKTLK